MSAITIADRKFLKKLVNESLLQEIGPSTPAAVADRTLGIYIPVAAEKVSSSHKQELDKILSTLSAEAKWVYSTGLEPTRGLENAIELQENEAMHDMMTELKTLKINDDEEKSINNIQIGLTSFVDAVGNSDILANIDGTRWGDEKYAALVYNNLKTTYSFGGTMDDQITKILNFRGNKHWGVPFEDFYVANLSEISETGAPYHYCAWKIANEKAFITALFVFANIVALGLSVYTGGLFAAAIGPKWAFVVDFFLFDFAMMEIIDIPQVNITYQDAAAPWIELKNDLINIDSSEREENATEQEIERYKDGKIMVRKLFQAWVYKYEKRAKEGKAPQAAALFREIMDETKQKNDVNINLVDKGMSKELLLQTINQDLETFRPFFAKINDSAEITLNLRAAAEVHLKQILSPNRQRQGGAPQPNRGPWNFPGYRGANPGGGPKSRNLKEIKGLDTGSREIEFDVLINNLLGRRRPGDDGEVSVGGRDIGGSGVEWLTSAFLSLYGNWGKYNVNLDGKVATGDVISLWDTLRRDFSIYKTRAGSDESTNPSIHKIMTHGWCVFSSMPLGHLGFFGHYLSMGIIAASPGESLIGSYRGDIGFGDVQNFAKMIRFGAIGMNANGKLIGPLHIGGIRDLTIRAFRKARAATALLEKIDTYLESGDPIYRKRKEFLEAYEDFYTSMGKMLQKCINGKLEGECGPAGLAKDIFKTFAITSEWEQKLDLEATR